jgi:arginase
MKELIDRIESAMKSRLALVGFPYDKNSSFMKGAAAAPSLIREAFLSESSNSWSETGIDLSADSLIFDAVDVNCLSSASAFDDIEATISLLLEHRLKPVSLGGDHSVTYPIIRAFKQKFRRLDILHFDAHPDLYNEFQGNRYSHASPFARIMEEHLVERLVQVGVRTMNAHQHEQAEKFGVEVIEMKQWSDDLAFQFSSPLYVSFDIDVLDPAFAPGVSHHEPGGLSTRQLINAIHKIEANVVGADIVEYNPHRDLNGMTAMVCAKILKELFALMLLH